MNLEELLRIYPSAKQIISPSNNPTFFETQIGPEMWLQLPNDSLTDTEMQLINKIAESILKTSSTDPWHSFLTKLTPSIPKMAPQSVQIIYYSVMFLDDVGNSSKWLEAFQEYFEDTIASFWESNDQGCLILNASKVHSGLNSGNELNGFLQLLDDDSNSHSRVFIGNVWRVNSSLPLIYDVESALAVADKVDQISNLSSSLLYYLLSPENRQHPYFATLRNDWFPDAETRQMVTQLYRSQGNVKKTAENLYIHRNTLLYRMDRFEKLTSMNLHNVNDLLCCYLLTL